jgi:cell division protein FtsN
MTSRHNEQQEIVTGGRTEQKNEALNLADFEIDDILSTPAERLLAEVREDFGDSASLAAEFDAIALPLLSGAQGGAADRRAVASASAVAQAASVIASRRVASPSVPWSFRHAIRTAAERLAAPLRSRAVLGASATLLLLAVLAPGVYRLLIKPAPVEQVAERPAPPSQYDLPAPPTPMSQPAPPLSQLTPSAPADVVQPSPVAAPVSPSSAAPVAAAPSSATPGTSPLIRREQAEAAAARGREVAQAPRRLSAPRQVETAAAEPAAPPSAAAPAPGREEGAALPPPRGSSFVVQLSIWSSEAQAQSSFRTLKSKYAVLNGREPLIKRTDDGRRGISYALQVGPFESSEEAERLCARLKASGGVCAVREN